MELAISASGKVEGVQLTVTAVEDRAQAELAGRYLKLRDA
jgi:hypothetical protein